MTREEILEKSRSENIGIMDERERQIDLTASSVSSLTGIVLCCLILLITFLCNGPTIICPTVATVIYGMQSANYLYMAFHSRKKRYWLLSILTVSIFAYFAYLLLESLL